MSVHVGVVSRVYKVNGAPMCDISSDVGAAVFLHCPILMLGGATAEQHMYVPPVTVGGRVIFTTFGGGHRAIILGSIAKADVGDRFQDAVEHDGEDDYPADKVALADSVWRNGGVAIVLTDSGILVLDAKEGGHPINVQLADGMPLRISQRGEEPTERLLLGGPTREVLDDLVGKVNALQVQVTALTTALLAATTLVKAAPPNAPVLGAALGLLLAPLGIPAPFAAAAASLTTGDLLASAILISDQSAGLDAPDEE